MKTLFILLFILMGSLGFSQKTIPPKRKIDVTKIKLRPPSRNMNIIRINNLHQRQAFIRRGNRYLLRQRALILQKQKNRSQQVSLRQKQLQQNQQRKAMLKRQEQLRRQRQLLLLKKRQLKRQQRLLQQRRVRH